MPSMYGRDGEVQVGEERIDVMIEIELGTFSTLEVSLDGWNFNGRSRGSRRGESTVFTAELAEPNNHFQSSRRPEKHAFHINVASSTRLNDDKVPSWIMGIMATAKHSMHLRPFLRHLPAPCREQEHDIMHQ